MKIAVCDDEQRDLETICSFLRQYDYSLNITQFITAKELLNAFTSDFFDLVFLDIEMSAPNGFEVAKVLMSKTTKPLIIFVTNSSEYTVRGYGIAFRYLTKPVEYGAISNILKLAFEIIVPQKILITVGEKKTMLSIHDIYYIEVSNHNLHFSTKLGDFCYRGKLKELEKNLPSIQFSKPHNSYIVNLEEIRIVTAHSVELNNECVVPISQRNRKKFELALAQYVRR